MPYGSCSLFEIDDYYIVEDIQAKDLKTSQVTQEMGLGAKNKDIHQGHY